MKVSAAVRERAAETRRTRWELHLCPIHRWTTEIADDRCGCRDEQGALCGEKFAVTTYVMPVGECQDLCLKGEHPE